MIGVIFSSLLCVLSFEIFSGKNISYILTWGLENRNVMWSCVNQEFSCFTVFLINCLLFVPPFKICQQHVHLKINPPLGPNKHCIWTHDVELWKELIKFQNKNCVLFC